MTGKIFEIPLHIYPRSVIFSFSANEKTVTDFMIKQRYQDFEYVHDIWTVGEDLTAKAVICENGVSIIVLKKFDFTPKDLGTLSHEIFHIAFMILDNMGISYSNKSDEAYAYLIGYITEQILLLITP